MTNKRKNELVKKEVNTTSHPPEGLLLLGIAIGILSAVLAIFMVARYLPVVPYVVANDWGAPLVINGNTTTAVTTIEIFIQEDRPQVLLHGIALDTFSSIEQTHWESISITYSNNPYHQVPILRCEGPFWLSRKDLLQLQFIPVGILIDSSDTCEYLTEVLNEQ